MKRGELLSALDMVRPGLATKEIIEQTTHFAFMGPQLVTYNDQISISHPISFDIGNAAVKAKELYSILSKIEEEDLSLELGDGHLVVKGKNASAGLKADLDIRMPISELGSNLLDQGEWKDLPNGFMEALSFCLFSTGKDMSHAALTCVHIQKHLVESSDGYRVTRYTIPDEECFLPEKLLLPNQAVKELVKFTPIQFCLTEGWAHFLQEDNTIFSCRTYSAEYPDMSGFFDNFQGVKLDLPKNLEGILDRASVFAAEEHKLDEMIEIRVEDKRIHVQSKNDVGWYYESGKMRYKGDPIAFATHPDFIRDVFKHVEETRVGMNDDGSPRSIMFYGNNWQHFALLK